MDELELVVGIDRWSVRLPEDRRIPLTRNSQGIGLTALPDPRIALQTALRAPLRFESLTRILTPDDLIILVFDERLPDRVGLLVAIIDELKLAGVTPDQVTILTPTGSQQAWLDDLPASVQEVKVEIHDPTERKKLSYLATTKLGRRIYLNKSLIDADQIIVLTGRRPDAYLGEIGGATALWPRFSDTEACDGILATWTRKGRDEFVTHLQAEATEVLALLGLPFIIEVVEAGNDGIAAIVAGRGDIATDVQAIFTSRWTATVPQRAALVIATISGDPRRHDLAELSQALRTASAVVEPGGRIVLLSQITPTLTESMQALRQADEPGDAVQQLGKYRPVDRIPAIDWGMAAHRSRLSIACGIDEVILEELSAQTVRDVRAVQRLIDACESVLVLPDAHQMRVRVLA